VDSHDRLSASERSILARFIAELFREPDDRWAGRVGNRAAHDELRSLTGAWPEARLGLQSLLEAEIGLDSCASSYVRLFGHTVRSDCPPYELEYHRGEVFQQVQGLSDLAGFYHAFGFLPNGPLAERPDHVVPQWECLAVLAWKEARAAEIPNRDGLEVCRRAQAHFLADHAGRWMPAFFSRVMKADRDGFYGAAARWADSVLRAWCRDFDVQLGPQWLELRPVTDDDVEIACGERSPEDRVELGATLAAAMERTRPQ
jgi:TorA maturation chaperone TorD